MATRPQFNADLQMMWRRGTLFRGVQVQPGDLLESTIPLRKRQDLYDSGFIEIAPPDLEPPEQEELADAQESDVLDDEPLEDEKPPHEELSEEERAALTQPEA